MSSPLPQTTTRSIDLPTIATDLLPISDIPRQLTIRQKIAVLLSICVGITAFFTYHSYLHMIDITGKETVPSIIAAEQIRTGLARAHTQIANLFLLKKRPMALQVLPMWRQLIRRMMTC